MPLNINYVQTGIIHVAWNDKVTLPEVEDGVQTCSRLADSFGDSTYVEIVDLTRCTQIPFDLRGLQRVATADTRVIGYVIVQPSQAAKVMADMLRQITHMPFRLVNAYDKAVETARDVLRGS